MSDIHSIKFTEIAHLLSTPSCANDEGAVTFGEAKLVQVDGPYKCVTGCPDCGADAQVIRSDERVFITCENPEEPCTPEIVAEKLGLTVEQLTAGLVDDICFSPGASPTGSNHIEWEEENPTQDVHRARLLLRYIRSQGYDVIFTKEKGWFLWSGAEWTSDGAAERINNMAIAVGDHLLDTSKQAEASAKAFYRPKGLTAAQEILLYRNEDTGVSRQTAEAHKTEEDNYKRERFKTATRLKKAAEGFHSTLLIRNMMEQMPKTDPDSLIRSVTDFDQNRDIIGVGNGVVDLATGELRDYRKDDLITRRIPINRVEGATNPRWSGFLLEVLGAPDVAYFFQNLLGYGITGHVSEHILPILYGQGGNGKGVLLETLSSIFKCQTVTTPFDTFQARPAGSIPNDLAAMAGARLVVASEGEQGAKMAESSIKALTGGDTISARFMRQEWFEFEPTFLILLATNFKPAFRGQDEGLWRRVRLISFHQKFEDSAKDKYLRDKFVGRPVPETAHRPGEDFGDGASGILEWAIQGAVRWRREGLAEPQSVRDETSQFRTDQDRLGEFLGTILKVTGVRKDKMNLTAVWNAYTAWCDDNREQPVHLRSTFSDMLDERPHITRCPLKGGGVVFRGVRLRRPSEIQADDSEEAASGGATVTQIGSTG